MPQCKAFINDDNGTMVCRCHGNAVVRVVIEDDTTGAFVFSFCKLHEATANVLAFHPRLLAIELFPVLELR